MSAVRTMQSLYLLSSLKAKFWALVKLGLGGWEDLRTWLISTLSSSASCWLSLVQAASMAVMYSKLGSCLGDTAKLGPLARTDPWAGVKGLLDRLVTHFGLGSSKEDPWGSVLGSRRWVVFPGTSAVCLWGSAVPLGSLGALCLAECLVDCLPDQVTSWLPARLEGGVTCLGRANTCRSVRGDCAACLEEEAPSLGRCEPAWVTDCLPWKPNCFLPWGEGEHLPDCLPGKLS